MQYVSDLKREALGKVTLTDSWLIMSSKQLPNVGIWELSKSCSATYFAILLSSKVPRLLSVIVTVF